MLIFPLFYLEFSSDEYVVEQNELVTVSMMFSEAFKFVIMWDVLLHLTVKKRETMPWRLSFSKWDSGASKIVLLQFH